MRRRSLRSCTGSQNPEQRVFTDGNGEVVHPHAIYGASRRIVHNAGLPTIRFHDHRHTHGSLLIAGGIPVEVVSERLGHAHIAHTIQTYQHLLPGMQEDAARTVARLGRPVAPSEPRSGDGRRNTALSRGTPGVRRRPRSLTWAFRTEAGGGGRI